MKNINYNCLVWLCFLASIALSVPLSGQTTYANKLLQDLARQLSSAHGIEVDQPDEIAVKALNTSQPLAIHRSKDKMIDHIGIKLFDRQMVEEQNTRIFYFVERYMLELLLSETDAAVQDRLQLERVKLTSDLPMSGKLRKDLQTIAAAFSTNLSLFLSNAGNRYKLLCMNGQQTVLSIEFPARYELITGYTKLEAENAIHMNMLAHKPTDTIASPTTGLREKRPGIYATDDDYYMMENIVPTTYYEKDGESYQPIFSQDLPVESICNLFNSGVDYGAVAEITQSLYGNKSNTYEVSIYQLTSYLRSQKCTLYTAIQRIEKDKVHGALIAVNSEMGYQHILTYVLEKSIIPQIRGQQIKMKMFSYVPIHNIASIIEGNK